MSDNQNGSFLVKLAAALFIGLAIGGGIFLLTH